MSDNRLAEIRARLEAATPGPWGFDGYSFYSLDGDTVVADDEDGTLCVSRADRDLIAAAPDDIRYLLAEVERLEAAAAEAKRVIGNLRIGAHYKSCPMAEVKYDSVEQACNCRDVLAVLAVRGSSHD